MKRLASVLAAAALLAVAPDARAGDGDVRPMSEEDRYAMTCGHLGTSCDSGDRPRKKARRVKGAGSRSKRRVKGAGSRGRTSPQRSDARRRTASAGR